MDFFLNSLSPRGKGRGVRGDCRRASGNEWGAAAKAGKSRTNFTRKKSCCCPPLCREKKNRAILECCCMLPGCAVSELTVLEFGVTWIRSSRCLSGARKGQSGAHRAVRGKSGTSVDRRMARCGIPFCWRRAKTGARATYNVNGRRIV